MILRRRGKRPLAAVVCMGAGLLAAWAVPAPFGLILLGCGAVLALGELTSWQPIAETLVGLALTAGLYWMHKELGLIG